MTEASEFIERLKDKADEITVRQSRTGVLVEVPIDAPENNDELVDHLRKAEAFIGKFMSGIGIQHEATDGHSPQLVYESYRDGKPGFHVKFELDTTQYNNLRVGDPDQWQSEIIDTIKAGIESLDAGDYAKIQEAGSKYLESKYRDASVPDLNQNSVAPEPVTQTVRPLTP
jgi:hypothetical protein